MIRSVALFYLLSVCLTSLVFLHGCQPSQPTSGFRILQDETADRLAIVRIEQPKPVLALIQEAKPDMRPFLHPIMAPDGNGELTQYSPGHHTHQTGLYWGFTRVNGTGAPADTLKKWFYNRNKPDRIKEMIGRDFFHFNGGSHWKRVSVNPLQAVGEEVQWKTVYHLLDEAGMPIMEETQTWTLSEQDSTYLLRLGWEGKALIDITINEFSYGGMFLRMPWHEGIGGEVINDSGQRNQEAEGQTAKWVDVGMEIEGRDDWGHIAIMDHPSNPDFPTPWRVDGQLGIGPTRAIGGDWQIQQGETATFEYQLVVYTGEFKKVKMERIWEDFSK